MSRILMPLLVVLALCGIVWLLLDNPAADSDSDPISTTALPSEESSPPADGTWPGTENRPTLQRTPLESPSINAETIAAQGSKDLILVSVVDDIDGEALPDAKVMVLLPNMEDFPWGNFSKETFESIYDYTFTAYQSDLLGQVWIPRPAGPLAIAGSTNNRFQHAILFDRSKNQITLRLKPMRKITVQVLDQDRQPLAGVAVALQKRFHNWSLRISDKASDSEGLVSFELPVDLDSLPNEVSLRVGVLALSPHPIEYVIDMTDLPQSPPQLLLPSSGPLHVQVLNSRGEPSAARCLVQLTHVGFIVDESPHLFMNGVQNPHANMLATTSDGVATFPRVVFNQQIKIIATTPNKKFEATYVGPGPDPNNPILQLRLQTKRVASTLSGRIMNTRGMVAKSLTFETSVIVEREGSFSKVEGAKIHTDASGHFRWVLAVPFVAGDKRTLTITRPGTRDKPLRLVDIDLSHMDQRGDYDLGDLVIESPAGIQRGRVVDSNGMAIHLASVHIEEETAESASRGFPASSKTPGSHDLTDATGRFMLYGDLIPGQYRVFVIHPTYALAEQVITYDGKDFEITLTRATLETD